MLIQIDGKAAPNFHGHISCEAVCVIPGIGVNILTKLTDPKDRLILKSFTEDGSDVLQTWKGDKLIKEVRKKIDP